MEARFDWRYFSGTMRQTLRDAESRWPGVLDAIETADTLVGRLVARETSYASDRPQDYVASILAVRCFRLAISAVYVALSGFPDSSPNIYRTIWEITIRLLDMTTDPVAGSLGYLLAGSRQKLSVASAERDHRVADGLPPSAALESRIMDYQARHERFEALAVARDLDPLKLERRYGRLNFREACDRLGIEKAYTVNYAFASGYAHERDIATQDFCSSDQDDRCFEMGPILDSRIEAVADTLRYLFLSVQGAAAIVGDQQLIADAEEVLCSLEGLPDWPSSAPASA